ncbi:hypothetical protein HMI54_009664 [Coelomomyces lativittatus]|nr:hypothetical protein HMI56_003264 [Coelomomyces lativittatus]KAJ1516394.1 hypothetical protein HMI54_009664 [Coelomomyces lativittatus]
MSLPIFYDTDENMNIAVRHATIKVLDLPRNISVYPKPPPIEDYKNSLQLHRQKIAPPSKSAQIAETFCPKPSYFFSPEALPKQEGDVDIHNLALPMPRIFFQKDAIPTVFKNTHSAFSRQKYHPFLSEDSLDTLRQDEIDLL